jgi:fibronectin type 3 domain-containing protein
MKLASRVISMATLAITLILHAGCGGNTGTPAGGNVTAPATPTGLAAAAGNTQISLNWNASSAATSYQVKRSTTTGGPYTVVSSQASTRFTDAGLTNGTKYFYVVSAANSAAQSANSNEASATPTAPAEPPPTPAGLKATPSHAQVTLTWQVSTGASGYRVKRSTSSGAEALISSPTSTTFTDTGLTDDTKYFYEVSAVNSSGESANSSEVNATPVPPTPAIPTNLAAVAGNAQVSLSWSASSGATSYHIKRSTSSGAELQIAAPSSTGFTDTGVTNGTKYFYVVSAVSSAAESANSNEASARPAAPLAAPATPTGLQATGGNAQVSLGWNASAGATGYHLKRATTAGGPFTTTLASPAIASYTDAAVTNGTAYFYEVSAVNPAGESANSAQVSATPAGAVVNVTITIDPSKAKPISPYIYGINFYSGVTGAPPQLTFDRAGGNRWTAYNWETNASNAGSDFEYENDDFLSSSTVPAEAVRTFIAGDQSNGLASLITVQLQGLVSADESGPVSVTNPPDLSRFRTVVDQKSTVSGVPFTITPLASGAHVFMDEFVWALDQKFSGAHIFGTNPAHPTFVSLDNEPELWNSTHLEVQGPNPVPSDEYIAKTLTMTQALKTQFPNMVIFGPVHYGFQGLYNWQGELSTTPSGNNWFPDKYLTALSAASATFGKPLVDVYDFHWYAEEYDSNGTRSLDLTGSTLTDAQVQLIVQSPRALWDPAFTDSTNSNPWIYEELGNTPIALLGRLQAKINAEFPGMRISMTEYESGGWNHIAGTIAQADNLGIFGAQGVFAANFWPPNGTYSYALAGFRAFRDFNGAGANFGDTSLQSTSSNVQNVVVYASSDSATPGRIVFVAINRSTSAQVTAIDGQPLAGTANLYQVTAASAQGQNPVRPVSVGTMAVGGSSLTLTLPALSVTTVEVN